MTEGESSSTGGDLGPDAIFLNEVGEVVTTARSRREV